MKPGIKTIIAGFLTFLASVVIPALVAMHLVFGHPPDSQFEIPGITKTAELQPGRYYLWNDFQTFYNGKTYRRSESLPDGIEIQIHEENAGILQFTGDPSISEKAGPNSRSSIGYVEIARPEKLVIEVSSNNEKRIFSFSKANLLHTFVLIAMCLVFSFLAGAVGVGLICWGIVKLTRAKKSAANRPIILGGMPGSSF